MKKYRKRFLAVLVGAAVVASLAGITYAAFSDRGKVLGSTFSVGNNDLKLYRDVALGGEPENLADELSGPLFTNIGQNWQQDYLVKMVNNGTYESEITSRASYETASDPDDLRQYIFAEIFPWDDGNSDGLLTPDELGESLGKKSIIKWKTEGYNLGSIGSNAVISLVVRFSTNNIPDTKQGKQAIFDFDFDSIEK